MQIVEFRANTLRFLDEPPATAPSDGFVWLFMEREELESKLPQLQHIAQSIGGSPVLDLHLKDLANRSHPSNYDYTSIYDLVIFRRLATEREVQVELGDTLPEPTELLSAFGRIRTRAVGFLVFDRLLVTVHPAGCAAARTFIQRYLGDVVQSVGAAAAARTRLPLSPADLMLRMLNMFVDSYLELRKVLNAQLDEWQQNLFAARSRGSDWAALMAARNALHTLEDMSEDQNDAVQEWLDAQREQPSPWIPEAERDGLLARARDVVEHIQRVVHHVRRMQQTAETAVQIHFSALGNRTNDIMRTLTALTAIFLPLNLIAGIFGMNFNHLPFTEVADGVYWVMAAMGVIALAMALVFWRKHYLRSR